MEKERGKHCLLDVLVCQNTYMPCTVPVLLNDQFQLWPCSFTICSKMRLLGDFKVTGNPVWYFLEMPASKSLIGNRKRFDKVISRSDIYSLCQLLAGSNSVDCFSPMGEWAELAGTAIASQPVGRAEQAPNCIPSSKNQGDNRRPSRDGPSCHTEKNRYYTWS